MFNLLHCVKNGHEIVALANLYPPLTDSDEMDSYMYQTVGHDLIPAYAECMQLPLFRREIKGGNISVEGDYQQTENDEVEDLFFLLQEIIQKMPEVQGISVGAILSTYQRVRVENVCSRLGLTSFSYLWQRDQVQLLNEMIDARMNCVLVKVAGMGLEEKHLGKSLQEMRPTLLKLYNQFGLHPCGEGGEYESLTLDCPLFKKRIQIIESKKIIHSNDAFAIVAYLKITKWILVDKPSDFNTESIGFPKIPQYLKVDFNSVLPSKPLITSNSMQIVLHPTTDTTLKDQITSIFEQLTRLLDEFQFSVDHIVATSVFVQDMNDFVQLNQEYKKFWTINPPARTTVQLNIPRVAMEVVLIKEPKQCLHVQSISYWAAANIGPYSQSIQVGNNNFIAGQIGLYPWSMQLASTFKDQFNVSLNNLSSILKATRSKLVGLVCYTTKLGFNEKGAITQFAGGSIPIINVLVPNLPKNAMVEFQSIAFNSEIVETYENTGEFKDFSFKTTSLIGESNQFHFSWLYSDSNSLNLNECIEKCLKTSSLTMITMNGFYVESLETESLPMGSFCPVSLIEHDSRCKFAFFCRLTSH